MPLDRTYLLPSIYAALVHLLVLLVISGAWIGQEQPERERPRHIEATMVDLDQLAMRNAAQQQAQEAELARAAQQAAARQEQLAQQRAEAQRLVQEQQRIEAQRAAEAEAQRVAQQRAAEEAARVAEQRRVAALKAKEEAEAKQREAQLQAQQEQRRKEAERKAAEQARIAEEKRQAEQRRQQEIARAEAQRQQAEAERQRAEAAEAERQREAALAQRRAAAEERANQVVGDMQSYIQGLLTSSWRLPATARNGMKAIVAIHLFPNGQIDQAYIHDSSGDQAFDRSAVQAVYRVERFDRVADVDPILFERRLRKILVTFRPEGLRW